MSEIERLAAIEEIRQLKARYFRTLDSKDWAGYEAVFAPDAVLDTRESLSVRDPATEEFDQPPMTFDLPRGRAAVAAFVQSSVKPFITVHHGHMAEIEILSTAKARGIWAMADCLWLRKEAEPNEAPFKSLRGYGQYHETYEVINGRWLNSSLKLTRLHVEML